MKVLVACEFSGVVRDAFLAEGHDAISCDLLPTENPGPHIQGDVRPLLREPWDLVIAHPPCQHLSRARGVMASPEDVAVAIAMFEACRAANAPKVAVENPTMFAEVKAIVGDADCWVHPYHFGDRRTKRTGFWLKNLPPLLPLGDCLDAVPYIVKRTGGHKNRSRFSPAMAAAMAKQWGNYP